MSDVVLVQAQPRNSTTGALVDVRLAGGGSRPYDQLGFSDWRGGLASLPRFATSIGFERSGWNGAALPQTGALRFFPAGDPALVAELSRLNWDGARVIVSLGDDEVGPSSYRRVFVGTAITCTARGGAIQVTLSDLSRDLDKPAAPDTFAGTGGLEGGDDATGRVKRRTFGYAFNIEGRLIDKAANVFEFGDPARPLRAFRMVKDKGLAASSVVTVDWQGSALATLSALRAASAPQGGAAVAPSIACVKWWTMPGGPLTADIEGESTGGYVSTAATIAARLVSIYAPNIAVLNTGEANGWKPATVGVHVEEGNETVASVLDRLLLPVGLVWIMGADGVLAFRRFTWDAPVETVRAETIERVTTYGPLRTRRLGFQRNHRQHTDAEINATVLLATDATYADGTPIEVLKPAQAAADITGRNTASAIVGQGPGATAADTDIFNSFLSISASGSLKGGGGGQVTYPGIGGKALGLLDQLFFGSPYLTESAGGASATLNAFKTVLGIASGFSGQGALASLSNIKLGAPSSAFPGFAFLINQTNGYYVSDADAITSQGVASGFSGQGSLATLSRLAYGSEYLTNFGNLAGVGNIMFGDNFLLESPGVKATNINYKTNQGTAAALTGQGALATLSSVAYGSDNVSGFGALAALTYVRTGGPAGQYAGIFDESGTGYVTDGGYKTSAGTAAGISGQGQLATRSYIKLGAPSDSFPGFAFLINESNGYYVSDAAAITSQGTAAAISGQGWGATASEAAAANKRVGVGSNRVVNSNFNRGFLGFTRQPATRPHNRDFAVALNYAGGYFGVRNVMTSFLSGPYTSDMGLLDVLTTRSNWFGIDPDWKKYALQVKNGDTIFASARMATHRCGAQLHAMLWTKDSEFITSVAFDLPRSTGGAENGNPNNMTLVGGLNTLTGVPTVAFMTLMWRMSPIGESDPYLFITEPMMGLAAPGQDTLPAFNEGPPDPVADQTSVNTASAVAGQGALATMSSLSRGSSYLTGFGNLAGANNVTFGEGVLLESTGIAATNASYKTNQGTAAAIAGQGQLATKTNVRLGNPSDPGYGPEWASLINQTNGYYVTDAFAITSLGTASAFAGQGSLATVSNISRSNVSSFFNFNAFQLGYSITRSDGVTTVTEQLVVTQVGVAAGFAGQGALASKNNAGYNELDVATLTAQTDDAVNGIFGGNFDAAITYVPNFGKDMAIKSGGTIYASFSGGSGNTNAANTAVYNSIEILDASDNSVLASVRLPYGAPGTNRLDNYIVMVPNRWGFRTIRWRVATRGSAGSQPNAASNVTNPQMTVQWKAL